MQTDSKEKILDLGVKVGIGDGQKRRWILISCTYLRSEILRDAREILMLPSFFLIWAMENSLLMRGAGL